MVRVMKVYEIKVTLKSITCQEANVMSITVSGKICLGFAWVFQSFTNCYQDATSELTQKYRITKFDKLNMIFTGLILKD